jgi:broad specificity phosphatase PhoE
MFAKRDGPSDHPFLLPEQRMNVDSIPNSLIFQRPLGYLVRHGSTEANASNCFRGWIDFRLDEEGRQAGEAIRNFFGWERIGRVICSDLSRAVETANYIMDGGSVCCPYLSVEPALRPWNIGEFAGKKKTDAVLRQFEKYVEDPKLVIPGGESLEQFQNRNTILMEFLANEYNGHPTVIVAHTSNINATYNTTESDASQPETGDIIEPGGVLAIYLVENRVVFVPRLGTATTSEPQGVS